MESNYLQREQLPVDLLVYSSFQRTKNENTDNGFSEEIHQNVNVLMT